MNDWAALSLSKPVRLRYMFVTGEKHCIRMLLPIFIILYGCLKRTLWMLTSFCDMEQSFYEQVQRLFVSRMHTMTQMLTMQHTFLLHAVLHWLAVGGSDMQRNIVFLASNLVPASACWYFAVYIFTCCLFCNWSSLVGLLPCNTGNLDNSFIHPSVNQQRLLKLNKFELSERPSSVLSTTQQHHMIHDTTIKTGKICGMIIMLILQISWGSPNETLLAAGWCVVSNKVAGEWVFKKKNPFVNIWGEVSLSWDEHFIETYKIILRSLCVIPSLGVIIFNHFIPLPFAMRHLCLYRQCDGTNFLPLKYWATRSCKKANARCGIFYKAFGIICLSAKHSGLTFSVYWLETFLFPPAAKRRLRNATGGCDLTFSSEPGSQWREWEPRRVAAEYPSAHFSWQNKVMEGRLEHWCVAASVGHVMKKNIVYIII